MIINNIVPIVNQGKTLNQRTLQVVWARSKEATLEKFTAPRLVPSFKWYVKTGMMINSVKKTGFSNIIVNFLFGFLNQTMNHG
jgi:hypothetical protein